ncbi:MAG: tetratricopeptide repeat protein [Endomicrobium sp.]|nr:tetratricopeptide repeat protein [Endomicrobium sp.]
MKKILSLLIVCFCFSTCCYKNMYQTQIDNAEKNFKEGNFSRTVEIYESLIQIEKVNNPYIYYNLSNAYYRNGNLGKAILNIEKALKLAPRDSEIKSNAQHLHSIAGNNMQKNLADIVLQHFSLNEITIAFSVVLILFIMSLSLLLIKRSLIFKKFTASLIVFLIVCIPLLCLKGCDEFSVRKAVLVSTSSIRSGPGNNNPEIFILPEGKIVSIIAKSGDWVNIKIESENEKLPGWVKSNAVGSVNE